MSVIEKLVTIISPDVCLVCGQDGQPVCQGCLLTEIPTLSPSCFVCGSISQHFETCKKCRRRMPIDNVYVFTKYDNYAKQMVSELKFSSSRSMAQVIAMSCQEILPVLSGTIITHLPTSPARYRQRGFDQSQLIAKHLAKGNYHYAKLLRRSSKSHQTGLTKAERQRQIKGVFIPANKYLIKGSEILIVDDVATTGSSLAEAARTLKKAGAKKVSAVVFART